MHATHQQAGACPQPAESAPALFGTVTRDGVFTLVRADGSDKYDPPTQVTEQPGYVVTDTGLQALDEAPRVLASLGEMPHAATLCDRGGNPHLGPCIEPGTGEAPGTAARILRSAALYLERHGWTQHAYFDPTATLFTPAADMAGAIAMVCYGGPVEAPAQHFDDPGFLDWEEAVLHLDRYLLVHDGSECYEFNDVPGRRIDDVLHVLREAASTPTHELIDALRAVKLAEQRLTALLGGER
jgi:hypothetical protein